MDTQLPENNVLGQIQNYQDSVAPQIGAAGASNTSSPFILNPQTGQTVANPGFLNAYQAFQLKLASDPQFAASMESELANLKQMETIVPTAEAQNYRDANGNTPMPGMTYADLQHGGFTAQTPGQNEEATQLKNALDALSKAYSASKSVNPLTAGLGGILSKIPGGSGLAGMLPGYSNYTSTVGALPTSLSALPGVNLQQQFANPGLVTQQGYDLAHSQIQTALNSIAPNSMQSTQPSSFTPGSLNPMQMQTAQTPYDATSNMVANPAQLGANARKYSGF